MSDFMHAVVKKENKPLIVIVKVLPFLGLGLSFLWIVIYLLRFNRV